MKLISPTVCLCLGVFVSALADKKVQKKGSDSEREGRHVGSSDCRQGYSNQYHTEECHQHPVTKYENQCHTEIEVEPVEVCTGPVTRKVCTPSHHHSHKEECSTHYRTECPHRRTKRGALQAVLLASAIAAQRTRGPPQTEHCFTVPHRYCRQISPNSVERQCHAHYTRRCHTHAPSTGRGQGRRRREAGRTKRGLLQAVLLSEAIRVQGIRRPPPTEHCFRAPHTDCKLVPVTTEYESCHDEEVSGESCSTQQQERQVEVCTQVPVETTETVCTTVNNCL